MKLLSFKKDGNKAVAHLLLDIEEFEKAVDKVWKRQRRWFNIPGFRKGKVPRGIVENEYGKDIFYESALELLYPKMLDYLVEESQEKIISIEGELYMQMDKESKPEIVNKDEENVEVKMNMNTYPKVDIDYENLVVEIAPERKATDKEIEDYKEGARKEMKSKYKYMDRDHRVVDDDLVRLNIDSIKELDAAGNEVDSNEFLRKIKNLEGFKLKIGSENFAPLEEAIKGHNIAEGSFQSELVFPENWPQKDMAGKKARATLQLITIKRPYTMLEVAQSNGFNTEEEFTNFVRGDINNYYSQIREESKRKGLMDKLSSLVPDGIVSGDLLEGRVRLAKKQLAEQVRENYNQSLDSWAEKSYPGKLEGLEREIGNSVRLELKKAIALGNIAEKESIVATEDEVSNYRSKLATQGIPYVNGLSDANIKEILIFNKTVEFLVSKVKFVDKKEEPKADAEKQKEAKSYDAVQSVEAKEPADTGANDSKKVTQPDVAHEGAEK